MNWKHYGVMIGEKKVYSKYVVETIIEMLIKDAKQYSVDGERMEYQIGRASCRERV